MEIDAKDLTKLATIHTNAQTQYYVQIDKIEYLKDVDSFANVKNLKIQILGNGTNILFTKKIYDDILFIKLGKDFDYFNLKNNEVEIGAAASFMRSGKKLIDCGYKEFLFMALIPGSLGGGVRQNAGTTKEGETKDNLVSVKVYDFKKNKILTLKKDELLFSYRDSILQQEPNRYLILSASFKLGRKVTNVDELKSLLQDKKKDRKVKQPSGYSFGSTFKSLLYEKPAWWYIKECNLAGYAIGGAKFSDKHSNWIINVNNASADDIIHLIEEAQKKVLESFGIKLAIEVDLI